MLSFGVPACPFSFFFSFPSFPLGHVGRREEKGEEEEEAGEERGVCYLILF